MQEKMRLIGRFSPRILCSG